MSRIRRDTETPAGREPGDESESALPPYRQAPAHVETLRQRAAADPISDEERARCLATIRAALASIERRWLARAGERGE